MNTKKPYWEKTRGAFTKSEKYDDRNAAIKTSTHRRPIQKRTHRGDAEGAEGEFENRDSAYSAFPW